MLVEKSELTDVRFYELGAGRVETKDENNYSLDVVTRAEGDELEVRCRALVKGAGAEYVADAAAVFTLAQPGQIPDDVARTFAEKVGVMSVYPYIRSALTQLGAQLAVARPILPLLRAGSVTLKRRDDASVDQE